MIAKIEFNLPEEQSDFEHAVNGTKAHLALWDMDQYLRGEIKYNDKDWQEVRDKLREITNGYNLRIDD